MRPRNPGNRLQTRYARFTVTYILAKAFGFHVARSYFELGRRKYRGAYRVTTAIAGYVTLHGSTPAHPALRRNRPSHANWRTVILAAELLKCLVYGPVSHEAPWLAISVTTGTSHGVEATVVAVAVATRIITATALEIENSVFGNITIHQPTALSSAARVQGSAYSRKPLVSSNTVVNNYDPDGVTSGPVVYGGGGNC